MQTKTKKQKNKNKKQKKTYSPMQTKTTEEKGRTGTAERFFECVYADALMCGCNVPYTNARLATHEQPSTRKQSRASIHLPLRC
jgi:hypothetical protein